MVCFGKCFVDFELEGRMTFTGAAYSLSLGNIMELYILAAAMAG